MKKLKRLDMDEESSGDEEDDNDLTLTRIPTNRYEWSVEIPIRTHEAKGKIRWYKRVFIWKRKEEIWLMLFKSIIRGPHIMKGLYLVLLLFIY